MTLYDIVMTTLTVTGIAGAIWASRKIDKAVKEGKVRYIGKVRIVRPITVDKPKL